MPASRAIPAGVSAHRSSGDKLALFAWLLLAVAFLLPNHYLPWMGFHGELCAGIAAWLLCWTLTTRAGGLQLSASAVWVLLVALVPLAQLALGLIGFAGDAWMASLYLFVFAACIAAGFSAGLGRQDQSSHKRELPMIVLCAAFLTAGIVSSGMVLCQWLRVSGMGAWLVDVRVGGRPYANLAQPNLLATLLALGQLATLYLMASRRLGALVAALAFLVQAWALALTQSRTGLMFGPTLLAWWWLSPRRARPFSGSAALLACLLCVGSWFLVPWANEELLLSSRVNLGERASVGVRQVIYQHGLAALTQSPWVGFGWMQVSVALASYVDPAIWSRPTQYSHNLFLDLLVWNGVPLGLLLIAGILSWFVMRARHCSTLQGWCAMAMLLVVFVHSQLEYPHAYGFFLWPMGFLIGSLDREVGAASVLRIPWRGWQAAQAIVVALTVWIVVEYMQIEADSRLLRFELARVGSLRAERPAPDILLLTQLREHHAMMRHQPRPDMSQAELRTLQHASWRYPSSALMFRTVVAHGLNGDPAAARREMRRLRMIFGPQRELQLRAELRELAELKYPQLLVLLGPEDPG